VAEQTKKANPVQKKKKEALVMETPVPSAPEKKTSQYVVTVDNQSGLAIKIEKLDEETGQRTELSQDEYAGVLAYASLAASNYYEGYGHYAPTGAAAQAYYQGVADYLKALAPQG
jgi:hypothetical protein